MMKLILIGFLSALLISFYAQGSLDNSEKVQLAPAQSVPKIVDTPTQNVALVSEKIEAQEEISLGSVLGVAFLAMFALSLVRQNRKF